MGTDLFYWIKMNMDFFNQDTIDWLKERKRKINQWI